MSRFRSVKWFEWAALIIPTGEERANILPIECHDAGNGALLAERCGEDLLWCPERNALMLWTGTHYEPDAGGVRAERLAEETIRAQFPRAALSSASVAKKR